MTIVAEKGLAPTRRVLDNGAVVIAKQATTTPAVTINAAVRAGSIYDTDALLGLSYLLSRVIDRGTLRRTADEIADELDGRGVSLSINVTRHVLSVSCNCLAEDFEAILDIVGDVLMRPTFPDEEIATRRGEVITAIRQDEDSPAVMAVEGLFSRLYPNGHPYGRRAKGTVESVARIDRAALQQFHRDRFAPATLSLAMVGDVESGRATDAAARVFGDWQAAAVAAPDLPRATPPPARQRLVVPMLNKVQADIAYGFVTIVRADPAYYAFMVMNNAFGQYSLGGRLGDSIRERQGMAYYVFSAFDANVVEGPLLIRAGVNPANVDRAIASIDEEVRRMAAEGITERELADSKRFLVGSMPRTLETNAAIANFLQTAEFFGLGLDYDLRLPEYLNAVTREEVDDAARRIMDTDRATIVVAGPYTGPSVP